MKQKALVAILISAILVLLPVYALAADRNFEFRNNLQLKNFKQPEGFLKRYQERVKLQPAFKDSYATETAKDSVRPASLRFVVTGDLVQLSTESVTLKINRASGSFKQLIGQTVSFLMVENSKVVGGKEVERLGLGILSGTRAIINGYEKEGCYFANRVVIKLPKRVVLNGRIADLTQSGFVMEVHAANTARKKAPETVEVVIYDKTRLTYTASIEPQLREGLYVNVVGYRKDDRIYAVRVVVKARPEVAGEETTGSVEPTGTVSTETVLTTPTTQPLVYDTVEEPEVAGDLLLLKIVSEIKEFLRGLLDFLGLRF